LSGQTEDFEWLADWRSAHGRPLRIIHIGNIANNGYINAKIQRAHGIDADVVSYDYYHVMGTPEWEDADFVGDVGDDAFPDWSRVDLRGFERPRWFAQGRLITCRRYLLARRSGRRLAAAFLWRKLVAERWFVSRQTRRAELTRVSVHAVRTTLRRMRSLVHLLAAHDVRPSESVVDEAAPSVGAVGESERRFRQLFPDRPAFDPGTFLSYLADAPNWMPLLERYDVIQAYALDPAIPYAAGLPYVAYEHGTLREIPFDESPTGQLCALTYRCAESVFITNSDNLEAARRLALEPDRVVPLPHAVDSSRLIRFRRDHETETAPSHGPIRVFSPARQDWVDGDRSWTKGNDRLLQGVRAALDEGTALELVLVAWGRDLDASRHLVEELGLGDVVRWMNTLRKEALWHEYLMSHVIADQFVLPAFGGVTFEALALGRRVVTSLDVDLAVEFFAEAPPVLVASSPSEVAAALQRVAGDPDDLAGIGVQGADWFARRHSSERIVELQLRAYRRMLDRRGAANTV
jgi:glycosyltransferase involved in cell wall biosynthesis